MTGTSNQQVTGAGVDTLFCALLGKPANRIPLMKLATTSSKIAAQSASNSFEDREPSISVTIQLPVARTRPNGILNRSNRFEAVPSVNRGGR